MEERLERARRAVMRFLEEGGYSESVRCAHRCCIRSLCETALDTGDEPTTDNVAAWLGAIRGRLRESTYKAWRIAAYRFADAWENGVVTLGVGYAHEGSPYYARLPEWARLLADRYVGDAADGRLEISHVEASACARFLLFACESGARGAGDLAPALVVRFVARASKDSRSPQSLLFQVKHFLRWLSRQGGGVPAVAAELSSVRYARRLPLCVGAEVPEAPATVEPQDFILLAEEYVGAHMASKGYADTQVGCARMVLRLAFCFLVLAGRGYSVETVLAWLAANEGSVGTQGKSYRRAVRAFERWRTEGPEAPHVVFRDVADLIDSAPDWSRGAIRRYLGLRAREGAAESTLAMCKSACVRFCAYSSSKGVSGFADVTPQVVASYVLEDPHETPAALAAYVHKVRGFLDWLADEGLSRPGLSLAAPSCLAPSTRVVHVLSPEQLRRVGEARRLASTPRELRDAAMVSLGLFMGLRASDVSGLRLSDVSWRDSTVTITQRKTLSTVTLPLVPEAGNSLAAYLTRGRPRSTSPRVFLSLHAPYEGVGRKACADALARVLGDLADGCRGFHELRRTFATGMLRGGSGVRPIADALGHASEGSVRVYLSLDERRMRECALPLSMLGGGGDR